MTGKLPPSASVAIPIEGAKLAAPSAERNAPALTDLLMRIAPNNGHALEIASGTGQHIIRFAAALPELVWTPSDVARDRLTSIQAYSQEAGLPNLEAPVLLDACTPGWSAVFAPKDLILNINLLHLVSTTAARTVIFEAAQALAPGGTLMLYGPFLRDGKTTSPGDARLDADLRTTDPAIGYKDRDKVLTWAQDAGLATRDIVEMPSNNLVLILRR